MHLAVALPRRAPACKLATCLNEGCLAALQAGLLVGSQARQGSGHCRLHTCRPSFCSACRHPAGQPARRLIYVSGYAMQFVLLALHKCPPHSKAASRLLLCPFSPHRDWSRNGLTGTLPPTWGGNDPYPTQTLCVGAPSAGQLDCLPSRPAWLPPQRCLSFA